MFKTKEQREFEKYKNIIEKSGLFDSKFYLRIYGDARKASETPIDHFIKTGLKEDRKPNFSFDPVWYRQHYKDIKENGAYPFVHYILFGRKENRFRNKDEYLQKSIKIKDNDNTIVDYALLQDSVLFDSDYYLDNYSDVREAKIDPVEHYLFYGFKEYRNPSVHFDTKFYLDTYVDIKEAGINPLVHYLTNGIKEKREPLPLTKEDSDVSLLLSYFKQDFIPPTFHSEKPIDIVIPVFNGFKYLEALFASLLKNTTMPYRLLVCDDKSSDEKVLPLLHKIKNQNKSINFILLENKKNLGFIGTVNRLVELTENHFVLLNTDTEVPRHWIERLMYPIFEMKNIASTTPFTNAGTICSFPNYLEDNPIFCNMSVDELDSYFQYINFERTYIEIPTGIGFCMGMNKDLVEKIGMFDTIFGKGYGEENDWCQRAIKNDYKNIHVTNLFVYHKHGGSFPSEEKKSLIAKNTIIINERYKDYNEQIQNTVNNNKLRYLREFLIFQIHSIKSYSILIFDHNLGGGANHYIDAEIDKRVQESQLICLVRYQFKDKKNYQIKILVKDKEFAFETKSIFALLDILKKLNFDEIFINSFVSFVNIPDIIAVTLDIQKKNKSKLIVPIHDYFPLCPSYTLLNEKSIYCGIPTDHNICKTCLTRNKGEFKQFEKELNIDNWRDSWKKFFSTAENILCFSKASKDIFLKAYPMFREKVIVKPHDISGRYKKIYTPIVDNSELRIGILGGINEAKGANVIKKLVQYIDKNKLNAKIVLIGIISIPISSPSFEMTGRYHHDELPELVKKLNITQFLIPSVCPETYSFVADEIMQLGYPLTVFNLGAPAERVANYPLGNVIEMDEIYSLIFGETV